MRGVLKTIRVQPEEWERWREVAVAGGFRLNGWIRRTLDVEAERVLAEVRRVEAAREERARLSRLSRGEF